MRNMKLPGTAAGFTPGEKQSAVRREPVNPRVAVSVTDVEIAIRCNREIGREVERRAGTHDGAVVHAGRAGVRRFAADTESQQKLAVGCELADAVIGVVGAIDGVVGADEETMRPRELA